MSRRPLVVLLVAVAVAAGDAVAGGYHVNEQGAKAVGKAGAFAADASDPSAITYNPAGIANLDGMQIYVGGSVVAPSVSFTDRDSGQTTHAPLACPFNETSVCSDKLATIPNLYLTRELTDQSTIGVAVTEPFGLGLRWGWPADAAERFVIREQSLSTLFLSAVAALKASQYVSGLTVALGADLVPAHLFLRRDIPLGEGEGEVRLGGDAMGAGGRLGFLYEPPTLPGARLGLVWRSPVTLGFHGLADFSVKGATPRSALPPDGRMATQLTLPQSAALGLAYNVTPWLGLESDVEWYDWSVLERLSIQLPDGSKSVNEKDWNDTFAARFGVSLALGFLTVRGGVAYDRSPVPAARLDPTLPDGDRKMAAAGMSVMLSAGLSLELAGLYVLPMTRDTANLPGEPLNKGSFRMSAWAISAGLGIKLDIEPVKAAEDEP